MKQLVIQNVGFLFKKCPKIPRRRLEDAVSCEGDDQRRLMGSNIRTNGRELCGGTQYVAIRVAASNLWILVRCEADFSVVSIPRRDY